MAASKKRRLNWLDTWRGVAIVFMIIYHTCWDLVNLYGVSMPWYNGTKGYILQQFICFSFILIAGYSFHLTSHHLRHGLIVFGAGVAVTLVTMVFLPSDPIYFGILTFIGSAILIVSFIKGVFDHIDSWVGIGLNLILFVLFRQVNNGHLGLKNFPIATLSPNLYKNLFSTWLGFPFPGFYSSDYFSVLPWIFLFLVGYYVYYLTKGNLAKAYGTVRFWGVLSFLGRHSLLIYLMHQVVIYAVLALFHMAGLL